MAYTYTTLKTAIQDYVQSTETTFVSQLPRFILNAEERILKECQLDVFRKSSQGIASNGNAYLQKPIDFLSQNSLSVINKVKIIVDNIAYGSKRLLERARGAIG